jgi:hypothetical protein
MAKSTGLGDNFYIGGYDLSGNVSALTRIGGGPAALDVTPINSSAYQRLGGNRDGSMEFTTFMDTAIGFEHAALSTLPTADVISSYYRGQVIGNACANLVAKQVNYDWTRGTDGSLTAAVQCVANGFGLEWGSQLTAGVRTDSTATAGTFFDNGAGFTFGAQGYLQVFAFAGTDVTVKIQHCTTSGGAYTDLITFTQVTSGTRQAQRVVVSNVTTVNEFLKATTVTTGGFSNLVFAAGVTVNQVAGQVF